MQGNKKETAFVTKGNPHSSTDETDFESVSGEMEEIDDLSDLADRKTFKLYGLKQNPKAPVVFKVTSVSTEQVSTGDKDAEADDNETPGTTTVTVWHGSENGKRDRNLSVVVGSDGSVLATATDGEVSYMIQSDRHNRRLANGKVPLTYVAAEINDLPEESEAEDGIDVEDGDEGHRALYSTANGERRLATTIRLMTVFTSKTRDTLGSTGCTNYHALAISQMNQFLRGSAMSNIVIQDAGWATTGFSDTTSRGRGDYLNALKNPSDYWMDGVQSYFQPVRDIDVVVVVGEHVYSGRASNVGTYRGGPAPYVYGYAEVKRTLGVLNAQWTYAHEVGHILGARHDYPQDSSGAYANHGNVYESWCDRSIMAYNNCPSSCSSCPRYPEFTAGRWYDEGFNNAYYMRQFSPTIAALY